MFAAAVRTVIIYILLIIVMRLSGKRQIGQVRLSELIGALMLSELATLPISDPTIPLLYSICPILLIVCFEIVIPFLCNRHPRLKRAIDGVPAIVIKKGKLDEGELKRLRLGIDELISVLRVKDIKDISEVEYAILEQDGQISVIPKEENRAVSLKDMNIFRTESGFAHPIIINGCISEFNLSLLGKDKAWLEGSLKNSSPGDILLMTLDDSGKINLIKKGDDSKA